MSLWDSPHWSIGVSCAVVLYAVWRRNRPHNRAPLLPPGPRRLPLIGSLLDVPTTDMERKFRDMSAKYGDVVYLEALGQPMVVLGSHEAAIDLLEKRSSIYSDRTISNMGELSGWGWLMSIQHYGPQWRRRRRGFHQHFNTAAVVKYQESQKHEACRFAQRIIDDPKNFLQYTRLVFAATILSVTYGIEIESFDSAYVAIAEAALAVFSAALVPGKYLVETFPSLRFLPSWFPGAKFKREGKAWTPRVHRLRDTAWNQALADIRDGTAKPSLVTSLINQIDKTGDARHAEELEIARDIAATAYTGGADTTLSSVQTFFLAMASFPEAQQKAQAELDAVVGPRRLPDFSDKSSLPYVCALVKECLRWRSVLPLGLSHGLIEDDVYRGYFIPKGTTVVANAWAYSRDPKFYPDPEVFFPDRFLKDGKPNPDVLDPSMIAFGYGRRICPGRHFAEASLFIIAATLLHTLSIRAPRDADGNPVKLEGKMTPGVLSYPEPFEANISSRGPWAEALIRGACMKPPA